MQRVAKRLTMLLCLGVGACSSDVGPSGPPDGGGSPDAGEHDAAPPEGFDDETGPGAPASPWVDLPEPVLSLQGGIATAPAGQGGTGGAVTVISSGAVRFDAAAPLDDWPALPAPATGGTVLDDQALRADVTSPGTLRLDGNAFTGGPDAVRTITSTGGDIVIDGLLRVGDLGAAGQAIALHAPAGTVFVAGAVLTTPVGIPADGDAGGAITIRARRVVIGGTLQTRGERNRHADGPGGAGGAITIAAVGGAVIADDALLDSGGGSAPAGGGPGGAIAITAAEAVLLSGRIDTAGGDASGDATTAGGHGGALRLAAGTALQLRSTVHLRGGAAVSAGGGADGGDGGRLDLDAGGIVTIAGLVDARGGLTIAAGEAVAIAGTGGALHLGEVWRPAEVRVRIPLIADGGHGDVSGGAGGAITLSPHGGELRIATAVQSNGGSSRLRPGRGGNINGEIGATAGGVVISGALLGRGGDAVDAAIDSDGGIAGDLYLRVFTPTGSFEVAATGEIGMDGGASSGLGRAGNGGFIDLMSRDGDFTMAGSLTSRGGDALGVGGTGGNGGPLYVYTDTDADGIGGNLTIAPTGVVDVSGGAGSIGGSATNNGRFGVEYFPDGRRQIAVLFNTDTATGELTDGQIQNLGMIFARGGASDGDGGDVVYHGRLPGHDADPAPGQLFVDAHGTGSDGQYFMQ